ncbi:MAG: MarR family transcriptional regulator [Actinomycetota bacterium]|nr:MarR family transcriptional regulator [Actinomycetota bacterium]
MPSQRPDTQVELSELLCFDLYAASRALTAVYRPLLAELGLTYPQYLVLVVLWRDEKQTVRQLSEALHLDYGTLTPLLRRMESNGLITRQRRLDDQRSVNIELTATGAALRSQVRHVQDAIRSAVGLDDTQVTALQVSLRSVAASAGDRPQGAGVARFPNGKPADTARHLPTVV